MRVPEKFRQETPQDQLKTIIGAMKGEILNSRDEITPIEKTRQRFSSYLDDLAKLLPWMRETW